MRTTHQATLPSFSLALITGLALTFGAVACAAKPAHPEPPSATDITTKSSDPGADIVPTEGPAASPKAEEAAGEGQPAEPEAVAAPSAEGIAFTVSDYKQQERGQTDPRLSLSATSHMGNITVNVTKLSYYCAPAPSFRASTEGRTLLLKLNKPTGAVARCMGLHDMKLSFAGLDMAAAYDDVRLESDNGLELAEANIIRAR